LNTPSEKQKKNADKHPYTPAKVGVGLDCLRTPEEERQAFALGYYIGRRCWDLQYELDQTEEQIKAKDSLAFFAGYDFGSFHSRKRVGKPYPPKRETNHPEFDLGG